MSPLLTLSIAATLFLAFACALSFLFAGSPQATTQRIQQIARSRGSSPLRRFDRATCARAITAIARWLRAHLGLTERAGLGDRLIAAGHRSPLAIDLYTAARILGPVAILLPACLVPFGRAFWIMALPAIAYLLPDLVLGHLIRRRRAALRKSLPDAIDLLVICVDAGLGLDQAMLRVAEELKGTHPAIHEELMQINREQRAGLPRVTAWELMARRVGLAEIDAFVSMLMQTERFGTPISRALSQFAATTRMKRTQRAEENAARTTVKIIFPLVLFIFPSIFIVLLGPAVITIMASLDTF